MIKYKIYRINKFVEEVSKKTPTPGGGSTAALSGCLSASLNAMVINFSIKKRTTKSRKNKLKKLLSKTLNAQKKLLDLIDLDSHAYEKVKKAYKTKKNIQGSLKYASKIPLKTAMLSYENLKTSKELLKIGNQNLLSDIGSSIYLSYSAVNGAAFNVFINLFFIKDKTFSKNIKKTTKHLIKKSEIIKINAFKRLEKSLC